MAYNTLRELVKDNIEIEIWDTLQDHLWTYIKQNYEPEDIFDDDRLEEWAEVNGYVKSEEDATEK